jgi:hypothetical protein
MCMRMYLSPEHLHEEHLLRLSQTRGFQAVQAVFEDAARSLAAQAEAARLHVLVRNKEGEDGLKAGTSTRALSGSTLHYL